MASRTPISARSFRVLGGIDSARPRDRGASRLRITTECPQAASSAPIDAPAGPPPITTASTGKPFTMRDSLLDRRFRGAVLQHGVTTAGLARAHPSGGISHGDTETPSSTPRTSAGNAGRHARFETRRERKQQPYDACVPVVFRTVLPPKAACEALDSARALHTLCLNAS